MGNWMKYPVWKISHCLFFTRKERNTACMTSNAAQQPMRMFEVERRVLKWGLS